MICDLSGTVAVESNGTIDLLSESDLLRDRLLNTTGNQILVRACVTYSYIWVAEILGLTDLESPWCVSFNR